jgi:hypothetical protein
MCECIPTIRKPYCGRKGCTWPASGEAMPSAFDMLLEAQPEPNANGSQIWFAVSNPDAVRGQPMALFRLQSEAQIFGGRMTLGDIEIVPVTIKLPPDIKQPNAPMPTVTIIG